MSQRFHQYVDEYQNVHIQDKVLGQGGQGIVFRTKDPDLAIKLVTDESGKPLTDDASIKEYSERFKRIRFLPLPDGLNISIPAALLQNNAGYVMQLLSEMVPFSHFWLDGKDAAKIAIKDIPGWLSELPEIDAKKIVHYYKTGGLRRRLIALYRCASLLARLHGNGLVYGDISPNNIFISEELENSSVWLIDADNIRFEIADGGSGVYTPRYGAPELVQGKDAGRPVSDCHAFAVVAFYLLSLIHPFVGKKVDGTDEGDWADDQNDAEGIEEKAYAGLFPWVDDQSDYSNYSDSGLPRSLLLTEKLKTLFEGTFGAGRVSPWMRPAIYHWPEALAQAADLTIQCPDCKMTYYYDFIHPETDDRSCPYCKTLGPQVLMLESYQWNGVGEPINTPCWRFVREISDNSEIPVPGRVLGDFNMATSDLEEVMISVLEKSIFIKRSESSKNILSVAVDSHEQNEFQEVYSQIEIDRKSSELRFWLFTNLNSSRLIRCAVRECGK